MNQADLVQAIYDRDGDLTKKDISKIVGLLIDVVSDELVDGGEVKLVGFGSFKVATRKEREGRNPKTGEAVTIEAKRVAKFVPGKELKERVAS